MSIAATELSVLHSVLHYRSFDDRKIELDPGITVLVGRNAVGKTNLVEALQLLTAGASFRKPTASELLRDGEGSGRMEPRSESPRPPSCCAMARDRAVSA